MKRIVVKAAVEDEIAKRKALTLVAGIEGVDSVAADMKEKKITIIGSADPVDVTGTLSKFGYAELLSVDPAKEEKKEEKEGEKEGKNPETKTESKPEVRRPLHIPWQQFPQPAIKFDGLWSADKTAGEELEKSNEQPMDVTHMSRRKLDLKRFLERRSGKLEKAKRNDLASIAGPKGVDSVEADMKGRRLIIDGRVNPRDVTARLHRMGPVKEEKKDEKEDKKKGKKPDTKKETKPEVRIGYIRYPHRWPQIILL